MKQWRGLNERIKAKYEMPMRWNMACEKVANTCQAWQRLLGIQPWAAWRCPSNQPMGLSVDCCRHLCKPPLYEGQALRQKDLVPCTCLFAPGNICTYKWLMTVNKSSQTNKRKTHTNQPATHTHKTHSQNTHTHTNQPTSYTHTQNTLTKHTHTHNTHTNQPATQTQKYLHT